MSESFPLRTVAGPVNIKPGDKWVGITTERSVGGAFFAVIYWLNPEHGGFVEPYDTGLGRYSERDDAWTEAASIAIDLGLPLAAR